MSNQYMIVDGHPDLRRDKKSGAIININTQEIQKQKEVLAAKKKQQQELTELKNEVGELKSLLLQLLEKKDNG